MIATAAVLQNVPLLEGLPDELLEQLARELTEVTVPAGEWILREGEPANSMFLIRRGRVEVIDERPPETVIRVLRRGAVLGELALLREGTRSASARARHDTMLLELDRSAFERLILDAPSVALGLTRSMGAQLAASRSPMVAATPPRAITVLGLEPAAPAGEVADGLAEALGRYGSVATLRDGELSTIDQSVRDADRVILHVPLTAAEDWTELCLAEADVLVAVTTGSPSRGWMQRKMALWGCELLVLGARATDDMLAAFRPREVQVIADASARRGALEQTGRRLAGRAVGVVLSGGGARGLAHLGAIEELAAAGIEIDRVAGVSMGAAVGAAAAAGFTADEAYEAFRLGFVASNPTRDFAPPVYSVIRGRRARRTLMEAFGDRRIEELPRRFFTVSCDLVTHQTVLHQTGLLFDAIYPSLAIPGVFPPVATADGRVLVDGGVLDNLPVATMARTGEGPVIALDVTGRMSDFSGPEPGRIARVRRPLRRALTGSNARIPQLGETLMSSVMVGSTYTVAAAREYADLVIKPNVKAIGLMDWKALPRVRELGRTAAREALQANPDLIERLRA